MVLQVGVQVVEQELLLLPFLHLRDDAQVQVHDQGLDLSSLPVLPKPARDVEQDCLEGRQNTIMNQLVYDLQEVGLKISLALLLYCLTARIWLKRA